MMSLAAGIRYSAEKITIVQSQRWEKAAPLFIVLLGLLVRIVRIEANGLRTDEVYSLWMASRTIPDLLGTVVIEGRDATPPTYNLMLHFVRLLTQDVWAARMITIIAGAGLVWATYELARKLFNFRIAAISALLIALSPFSIEYSQVARTYALSGLLAFLSMYFLMSMWISPERRLPRWLYVITTLAAFSTHYLTIFVVVAQNLFVVILVVLRRLSRPLLWRWGRLQTLIALLGLPLILLALPKIPVSAPGTGQAWLAKPSLQGLVRTMILWGTGDPSYGPSGFTLVRLFSLVVIASLLALGARAAWNRWNMGPEYREEVRRIVFVGSAFIAPLFLAIGISLFRRVFNEKYFLFLIPFLIIILAWSALRIRPAAVGWGLLIALTGLTLLSLTIYYTAPAGEQWREAVAYIRQEGQTSDPVAVVAPGYYMRPLAYYLTDSLPPHDDRLSDFAVAIMGPDGFLVTDSEPGSPSLAQVEDALSPVETIWLVTGYTPVQPERLSWFWQNYTETDRQEFLGVRVIRGERK